MRTLSSVVQPAGERAPEDKSAKGAVARGDGAKDTSGPKNQERSTKRKKASRACYHCQKAHLTCDDSRPCQRCIRKGLADQCVDGFRKKAKYLLEEDEYATRAVPNQFKDTTAPAHLLSGAVAPEGLTLPAQAQKYSPPTSIFDQTPPAHANFSGGEAPQASFSIDRTASTGFDVPSLEYSILSSMVHDADSGRSFSSDSPDLAPSQTMDLMDMYTKLNNAQPMGGAGDFNTLGSLNRLNVQHPSQNVFDSKRDPFYTGPPPMPLQMASGTPAGMQERRPGNTTLGNSTYEPESVVSPSAISQASSGEARTSGTPAPLLSQGDAEHARRASGSSERMVQGTNEADAWRNRVARVYRDDTRPFRYTEGYHILLKYATQKFDKADVLRIVRALAIFRPSLIALQMPLSEEDEIFVERAFQRTILEFEKLVTFSGTPTVVWRRTCEISLVGTEFCMLTQWSKEDLLGKYIYQLMDKNSVLDYWCVRPNLRHN